MSVPRALAADAEKSQSVKEHNAWHSRSLIPAWMRDILRLSGLYPRRPHSAKVIDDCAVRDDYSEVTDALNKC